MKAEEIKRVVKERYSKAAQTYGATEDSCCCPSAAPPGAEFAERQDLYTPEDLASVPELAAKLSRGCGNPVSFADLRAGEVVVDLGCGAGIDVIFAARRIAPGGRVVGVDFAQPMIERARQAVAEAGLTDLVEFVVGDFAESYLPDDFADAVISNCVINLCPDKDSVYREAFRILKPGGRLAISDVDYSQKPAHEVKSRFEATWAGCVGGAMEERAYFDLIRQAGFEEIRIVCQTFPWPNRTGRNGFLPRPRIHPTSRKRGSCRCTGDGNEHQVHRNKTISSTGNAARAIKLSSSACPSRSWSATPQFVNDVTAIRGKLSTLVSQIHMGLSCARQIFALTSWPSFAEVSIELWLY
jgi:arsenite methyltransferase